MNWAQVLMIIVSFCGGYGGYNSDRDGSCRHERIQCVKNGVALNPSGDNGVEIIDACLSNPKVFPTPAAKAALSSEPHPVASLPAQAEKHPDRKDKIQK